MSVLAPPPVENTPLARLNPVAKLLAALIVMLALLASADWLTATATLALELALLPLAGLTATGLWRRSRPLMIGLAGVFVSNLLLARSDAGSTLVALGPLTVTADEFAVATAVTVRLAAVALPGIVFVAGTDPVDLADALVQQWRASPRFAYGALAALRLLPLLAQEWGTLGSARRARGIDAGRNPVRALRLFASRVFGLLVVAIRRGTRLATAMDARGFDSGLPRTQARQQQVGRADRVLVITVLAVMTGIVLLSVATGHWRLVVS